MRELKFRAWDESLKYYFYNVAVYPNNVVAIQRHNIESMVLEANGMTHWTELDGNAITEQYTGLKDKNGKEIYEGDIVVNTYYDDGEMYKVLWVDDSVAFGMESLDDMELYKLPLESLEVIGNIHENAELLG